MVREAHFQQTQAATFSDMPMKVIVQPVDNTKVKVPDPADDTGTRFLHTSYTYLVSIVLADDMEQPTELAPPPGSAVLCEMLENAIDAKASTVAVLVSPNTFDRIEVRDNGDGISRYRSLFNCSQPFKNPAAFPVQIYLL